ncbi:leucine-rich repeat-containing protein kinase family protein [Asticcacaulis sp. YBE204]|uniref:leucine-rich repeat-containing protein kinase family protein n=1 Tax=Asticcacaulis sp. YBE204 TaxID=1282363 RepID=UPI0003C40DE7|nr:leucine-rich repeat-containing protein kinase family protein [Asticcacaulis sp. YBE204]ESQ81337.1 hypothetical protein AEYBE204_03065 [Asticcacaulis sp. YBE204]
MLQTLEQLHAGLLAGVTHLQLREPLDVFPDAIFDLADTLEILDLNGTGLSALPEDMHRLHRLRILFCSNNAFTVLPESLGRCPALTMIGFKANRIRDVPGSALPVNLRWLILTDNAIETLPKEIGHCAALQKCMLAGNKISLLPESMINCKALELLRLSANRFEALPRWVFTLPRLSWLALAGNPLTAGIEAEVLANADSDVAWADVDVGPTLGEGASGVIYRALHKGEAVAAKLFKGAVTSDGLPESEMAASLRTGRHTNLIPVRGRITGHPEGRQGLVMDLIEADFMTLAGPPSFATCTRDVYDDTVRFDATTAVRMAHGIASAARHLHERGVLHGDLYAHNILHDGKGYAILGDFGGAALYDAESVDGAALQRIEVRAFGCLLEELIARCAEQSEQTEALGRLGSACLHLNPRQRPLFAEIERECARLL